jgi:hypothetical protein
MNMEKPELRIGSENRRKMENARNVITLLKFLKTQ